MSLITPSMKHHLVKTNDTVIYLGVAKHREGDANELYLKLEQACLEVLADLPPIHNPGEEVSIPARRVAFLPPGVAPR